MTRFLKLDLARPKVLRSTIALMLAALFLRPLPCCAQADLSYYLPEGVSYAADVPRPSAVLGWEVGEWHVRHDQLVAYLRLLAESSERMRIETIGWTHEHRPLLNLVVSSPANLARLDEIVAEHRRLSDPAAEPPETAGMPVVVYLGYSIHGNEPSGSNASLLVAYHLAAAEGAEIDRLLDGAVIVIDPSLNPDGLARFAGWANMHRGKVPVADKDHREHREGWPNGRTNHYWFDLNRDWLLAQQPESRARLEQFHRWRPNVLADFHEMETDSTYFFQPGVPSRRNPLTPLKNVELTHQLAQHHARALDSIGSLYFTEERFDDYYYGKGSTYPDIHGAIGILFEQARARGQVQESVNGLLTFPFAIRNQFLTSLSTLEGALSKRQELLRYQSEFYRSALEQAAAGDIAGYVFGDPADPARGFHMVELLRRHRIEVHELGAALTLGDRSFAAGKAWVVPAAQPQYRLVRSLFEKRVDFPDTSFYDVSTWTVPLAFDQPHLALDRRAWHPGLVGDRVDRAVFPAGSFAADPEAYAYVFDWDGYYAPRALFTLLDAGFRARVAMRPFSAETEAGRSAFARGAIVVPSAAQEVDRPRLEELLGELAVRDAIEVHSVAGGLTAEGVDLGSPNVKAVELPKPALVVGREVETYAAGEIWHLLDQRFGMPLALIDVADLESADLGETTHLILADGKYEGLSREIREEIRRWVDRGGVLIALQKAAAWAEVEILRPPAGDKVPPEGGEWNQGPKGGEWNQESSPDEDRSENAASAESGAAGAAKDREVERRPYEDYADDRAAKKIRGTIFRVELDLTHPLAYGYRRVGLPVFRNGRTILEPPSDPYATVAVYSDSPLLSGYVSEENYARIQGSPALIAERLGRGAVIRMADGPNFRSFWYGTNKLFLNALFFGGLLDDTSKP